MPQIELIVMGASFLTTELGANFLAFWVVFIIVFDCTSCLSVTWLGGSSSFVTQSHPASCKQAGNLLSLGKGLEQGVVLIETAGAMGTPCTGVCREEPCGSCLSWLEGRTALLHPQCISVRACITIYAA